jgi:hypothetical protein
VLSFIISATLIQIIKQDQGLVYETTRCYRDPEKN